MKNCISYIAAFILTGLLGVAQAATLTVTSSASSGAGTLDAAITALNDGDTIAFNIPGAGPHYIIPPVGGFQLITKNNITIDGYTQPGSSPNTSTILSSNNAVIKIVLKGTDDGTTGNRHFTDLTAQGVIGFTDGEEAILALIGANNATVRGLCFLGDWADGPNNDPNPPFFLSEYGIALGGNAVSANAHISGCRFGLDADGVTVGRLKDGIAWFGLGVEYLTIGVGTNAATAAAARAQFNIFMGMYIAGIGDGGPLRICGNFFNVYPDGLHDYTVNTDDGSLGHSMEAFIESNARATSLLIGTDGDGVNDAEERNVFGGVTEAGDRRFLEWYGSGPSDYRIAGNYFGMGVDGLTRFTNGGPNMQLVESFKRPAPVQFGSDFDGVSDAIEANVVSWNYPFAALYPDPLVPNLQSKWRFANIDVGTAPVVSLRGNKMIGMEPAPFTYIGRPADAAGRLSAYTNYVADFMIPVDDYNTFFPTLSSASTPARLIGTCAAPNAGNGYTTLVIDVYAADPESWANGKTFGFEALTVNGVANGFPMGKTYLGSYLDNGPSDSDSRDGFFNLNISALGLAPGAFVTVTANYSQSPVGTHNAVTHTSNFANPVTLQTPHGNIVLVTVADDGTSANTGAPGTLHRAITNAQAGDTIVFNIAGVGPHYLQTPPLGFPLIYKQHNLVIDGYSQPGASPNSNPITGANNAVIKIVIDGRLGGTRDMAYEAYDGTLATSDPPIDNTSMATERSGYGHDELALLGIYRSTNVTVRGFAFLGTMTPLNTGTVKGICLAHDYGLVTNGASPLNYLDSSDAYTHISGCWFGVNPTNPTVEGVQQSGYALAMYRHRSRSSGDSRPELPNYYLTVGVKPGSADPRAEFNIFVGHAYAFDGENIRTRVSGNFFGVMPDGVTPYNTTELQPDNFDGGHFEFGRYADTVPMIIGTDGDGVNDADEGNIFGPLALINFQKPAMFDLYGSSRKAYIIAGNRFSVAGDGTRWTNSSFTIGSFGLNAGMQVRFGSDFNGVSDALEANLVYNNHPFSELYTNPPSDIAPSLLTTLNGQAATDGWLSARGNVLVGSWPLYNPGDGTASQYVNSWSNYVADPTDNSATPAETVPVLTASTITTLNGTCGLPNNSYTNLVVDVYLPDAESQTNGALFDYPFFGGTAGAGFVNGKTHLGAFLDNGPYDSNPAVGAFSFNVAGLGLAHGTKVTVAVTYSRFARPSFTSINHSGSTTTLVWTGDNGGPFNVAGQGGPSSGFGVQSASSLDGPWTTTFAAGNSAVVSAPGGAGYYRIVAPLSGMTTLCATPVTLP